jgi:hypothetical protein
MEPQTVLNASCLACGEPLEFHQPDLDLPDRLLGICLACKVWFLIQLDIDGTPTPAKPIGFPKPGPGDQADGERSTRGGGD